MCAKTKFSRRVEGQLLEIERFQKELFLMKDFYEELTPDGITIEPQVNEIINKFHNLFLDIGVNELNRMIGKQK